MRSWFGRYIGTVRVW